MTPERHITDAAHPEKNIRMLFVCYASHTVGMGHLLRTSHVAGVCSQYADVRIGMLGAQSLCGRLKKKVASSCFFDDEGALAAWADEWAPDLVCFDLLSIGDAVFSRLTARRLSASLSPIFSHLAQVDILFHRSSVQPKFWETFPTEMNIYSGLKYAMIDERVIHIPTAHYKQILNKTALPVGISMGGADAANKTLALLASLKKMPIPMVFWVLLGEGYAHSYEELVHVLDDSPHEILLIKSNESMWQILQQCALVFLAGGVTSFEAAYAGLPSVNLLERESTSFLLEELAEKGVLHHLRGESMERLCEKALLELSFLDANREILLRMHQKARSCGLDKQGTSRVVKNLLRQVMKRQYGSPERP